MPGCRLSGKQKCTHAGLFPVDSALLSDTGLLIKGTDFFGYCSPSFFFWSCRIQRFCLIAAFHERHARVNIPRILGFFLHCSSNCSLVQVMDMITFGKGREIGNVKMRVVF